MHTSSPFFVAGAQRSGTTLLDRFPHGDPEPLVMNQLWDPYPSVSGEPARMTARDRARYDLHPWESRIDRWQNPPGWGESADG